MRRKRTSEKSSPTRFCGRWQAGGTSHSPHARARAHTHTHTRCTGCQHAVARIPRYYMYNCKDVIDNLKRGARKGPAVLRLEGKDRLWCVCVCVCVCVCARARACRAASASSRATAGTASASCRAARCVCVRACVRAHVGGGDFSVSNTPDQTLQRASPGPGPICSVSSPLDRLSDRFSDR